MTGLSAPAVELCGLTKRFGAVTANSGVNLRVGPATIHGVVGENGAGKTTAMRLLYGMHKPDAGEIWLDGERRQWASPAEAIAAGLGMVHQHFMLAGPFSALDNVLLGAEPTRYGIIQRRNARSDLEHLSSRYGLPVDWQRSVQDLPIGIQQRIEILKLLFRGAKILILDEPTAVLTPQECSELFENLRKLRGEGKTILLITHKLKEVIALTDQVTVLRAGTVVGTTPTSQTTAQELANLMVGRKVALSLSVAPGRPGDRTAIEARQLSLAGAKESRHRLSEVSFSVRRGEIVGVAGVEGNGQSELLQALLHPGDPRCRTSGTVRFLEQDVTRWDAGRIRNLGVAFIPEDRHLEGMLLQRPVRDNYLLGHQRRREFCWRGLLRPRELDHLAANALEKYDVRPRKLEALAADLSGGNQQKLVLAREFQGKPKVVIAAQPTRGLDVGAIQFVHQQIVRARDEGAGVLLISSELEEILALSDRILVIYEGRLVAEFGRGTVSEETLGLKMGGH